MYRPTFERHSAAFVKAAELSKDAVHSIHQHRQQLTAVEQLAVHLQAKRRTGPSPADGAQLIWRMVQILEKGSETEWVKTIVTVRNQAHCACWLLTLHVASPRAQGVMGR